MLLIIKRQRVHPPPRQRAQHPAPALILTNSSLPQTTSLSSGMNQSGNKVMSMISSISSSLSGRSGSGLSLTDKRNRNKAGRMFKRLDEVFYRRFEREDVIDKRMTLDFIENLANAPPKTEAEQTQITKSLNLVQEHSVATRLSGTDNDPVEKFYHR